MQDPRVPIEVKKESIENALLSLLILENTLNDIVDLSLLLSNQFYLIVNEFSIIKLIKEIRQIVYKHLEIK